MIAMEVIPSRNLLYVTSIVYYSLNFLLLSSLYLSLRHFLAVLQADNATETDLLKFIVFAK